MMIISILAAPNPKRAVWYDKEKDDLVFQIADIIGLISMENPDDPEELCTIPMYMTPDNFGGYSLPQMDINFIEFIDLDTNIDLGKYLDIIIEIKKLYEEIESETVEVETKGNVSQIKRFIRPLKKETPKDDNQ